MLHAYTRLKTILGEVPIRLRELSDEEASEKPAPEKWSSKEIIGHLLDSAANNLQRFVRLQIEDDIPLLPYRQNEWVVLQHYQAYKWDQLLHLWETYNRHLLHVLSVLDERKLANKGHFPEYGTQSLQFIIDDYVDHMIHHLKTVTGWDEPEN